MEIPTGILHRVQYADYEENQWTVPTELTPERWDKIINDHSVCGILLLPNTVIKKSTTPTGDK